MGRLGQHIPQASQLNQLLLSSTEFRDQLAASLGSAKDSVIVLSGFMKANALEWMLTNSQAKTVKVVSRWRKHDLICGASDFECYKICRDANIDFGVSLDLHGKVFSVDHQVFVGSANLTSRGMALSKNFNSEFGVGFAAGEGDKTKIDNYLTSVTWITNDLAAKIEEELKDLSLDQPISDQDWSSELKNILSHPIKHLWMHELLFSTPADILSFDANDENQLHDYQLLGLDIDTINRKSLAEEFKESNAFRWLNDLLQQEKSMSFGAVSAHLHNAILDDPLPYRRDVKTLVTNLFAWFSALPEYEISRPRHSQVIKQVNAEVSIKR